MVFIAWQGNFMDDAKRPICVIIRCYGCGFKAESDFFGDDEKREMELQLLEEHEKYDPECNDIIVIKRV